MEYIKTGNVIAKRWYTGVCYCFEFQENGVDYLGASLDGSFQTAIVQEQIPGQELKQLRELEAAVTDKP